MRLPVLRLLGLAALLQLAACRRNDKYLADFGTHGVTPVMIFCRIRAVGGFFGVVEAAAWSYRSCVTLSELDLIGG